MPYIAFPIARLGHVVASLIVESSIKSGTANAYARVMATKVLSPRPRINATRRAFCNLIGQSKNGMINMDITVYSYTIGPRTLSSVYYYLLLVRGN